MNNLIFRSGFKKQIVWISVMAVAVLAACQAAPAPAAPAEEMEESAAPAAAVDEAVISVASDPTLGEILVGANGMTLYMFANDEFNTSNCAGDCLVNWPPLLTMGKPVLGDGVDASLVSSAALPDGTLIVTYNGMPLYYWMNDKAAGDVTGQNVGGVWFVVAPNGMPVGIGMPEANANDNMNSNNNMNSNENMNSNDNMNSNANMNSNSNENSNDDDDD